MAGHAFSTGQTVKLRSGGPVMTVIGTNALNPSMYVCQWFAGKTLKQGEFPSQNLKEATEEVPQRRYLG